MISNDKINSIWNHKEAHKKQKQESHWFDAQHV